MSGLVVEEVDLAEALAVAPALLSAAWPRPAVSYTLAHLRWQLTFPGGPATALVARIGGEPVGFVGATPRQLRFRGRTHPSAVGSFMAVRPEVEGRGVSWLLYEALMERLERAGRPVVSFCDPGTPAALTLFLRHARKAGLTVRPLATCASWGLLPRSGASPAARPGSPREVLAVIERCGGDRVWAALDERSFAHHLGDPRGCSFVVVERDERVTAAARVVLAEIATAQGLERVVTIDAAWAPEPDAEQVRALFEGAAAAFAGRATAEAVLAPNLSTIDDAALRGAGLRRTGARYEAFGYERGGLLEGATGSNHEVV